jgi:glycosyltransferase involved in cell wall biosynthesis
MRSNSEKITILVANYNNGKYLEECISSVTAQTCGAWELCIVDDGSGDNSREIYRKYEDNPQIHIHYNEKNIGYIKTLKKLIDLAETDIVGILDADDKLAPAAVEKVLRKYGQYFKAGFVYTNFWYCDEQMNIIRPGFCKPLPKGYTNLETLSTSHFKTFRKSVYERTEGYDEEILYAEDKDLVFKMEEVTRLHMVNEPLYYYRELETSESHGGERSKQSERSYRKARENAFKRRGLPNRDKFFEKLIHRDFDYSRKRRISKAPLAINKQDGLENLLSARKIFNELGIDYWLSDGTLLGCYREKDFIKHDFDLDIGCHIKDYDDRIIMRFVDEGWVFHKMLGRKDLGLELTFIRDYLKLDIFWFYEEDNRVWYANWDETKRGLNLIKFYFEPFTLKKSAFLGHEFLVPEDTLTYIEAKYGKKWRQPVKDWNFAESPANAHRTQVFMDLYK